MSIKELLRTLAGREKLVDKDAWIRDHVAGLSFADIGGLWGTVNEKVTVALKAGAKSATMIDCQLPDSKWWTRFHERCQSMNIRDYQSLQGDICKPNAVKTLGRYDMVHCSGIIYHVADIFGFLRNLYQVTGRYLILTSMIVPEVIENAHGRVSVPEGVLYSVPLLSGRDRDVLAKYFDDLGVTVRGINAESPVYLTEAVRFRTGPWWWLFSPGTLKRMVRILPFDVLNEGFSSGRKSYSLLLKANHPVTGSE